MGETAPGTSGVKAVDVGRVAASYGPHLSLVRLFLKSQAKATSFYSLVMMTAFATIGPNYVKQARSSTWR